MRLAGNKARSMAWLAMAAVALACAPALRAGDVIDRIVATVNNDVVLASDLDQAARFEALVNGGAPDPDAQELQRLIDQVLLLQQMRRIGYAPATDEDLRTAVADLRAKNSSLKTDAGWQAALAALGLGEQDVKDRLATQIAITRFVDQRFRPGIRVDSSEIRRYYEETLVPQLRAQAVAAPPLAAVASKIEQVLVEKDIDERLDGWLKSWRSERQIHIVGGEAPLVAGARP